MKFYFKYKYDLKECKGYTRLISVECDNPPLAWVLAEQRMYSECVENDYSNPRELKIRNK